jgi:hypothetical protein
MTLYWTVGGTAFLDTVGGWAEDAARQRDAGAIMVGVVVVAAKLVGGGLALALFGPDRFRHERLLVRVAKVAGVVLVVYGTASVIGAALGLVGVAGDEVDRQALWGHALVWDPWFVVWGALLWLAARVPGRAIRAPIDRHRESRS